MDTFLRVDISLWSFVVLLILYLSARSRFDFRNPSSRLLLVFIGSTTLVSAFDVLGWAFEGLPGPLALFMNWVGNLLLYAGNPFPVAIWLFYTKSLLDQDSRLFNGVARVVQGLLAINALFTVLSLKTGWYFKITPDNQYSRGPWFFFHMGLSLGIVLISISMILLFRRRIRSRMSGLLLGYYIFPLVGAVLQTVFYGVSLTWPMTALSVLFIYQHMIDSHLTTDYLTGSLNRLHFEKLLMKKLAQVRPDQCLVLISADIDWFKQINDQFGHAVGDLALQNTVHVLRQCLRPEDIIARVGGDEFYIILQSPNRINLEQTIQRFQQAFRLFNETGGQPYTLQLSFGWAVYEKAQYASAQELLKQADIKMYENKPASVQKRAMS